MDTLTGLGVILLAIGAFFTIFGALIRTGLVQADIARQYRDPGLPDFQRTGVFAFIPLGLSIIALGAFVPLRTIPEWGIVLALLFGGFGGCIWAVAVMLRPPQWLKPQ